MSGTSERTEAVDALAHRIRTFRDGDDPRAFAAGFIEALWGRGWRPTSNKKAPEWQAGGLPRERVREHADEARRRLREGGTP